MLGTKKYCWGLIQQAAKHHTVVHSHPHRGMGERTGENLKLVGVLVLVKGEKS